jgi:hypothetical protein
MSNESGVSFFDILDNTVNNITLSQKKLFDFT